jgi:hypothetical protein
MRHFSMKKWHQCMIITVALVMGFAFALSASTAMAHKEPPPCPKNEVCICHNIGGPRDLGANCDGTGNCSFTTDIGTVNVLAGQFLGIIIGFNQNSAGALAAHIAHGDGRILATFDPPLHLASQGQNHQASNVECLGLRVVPQPPEPGN